MDAKKLKEILRLHAEWLADNKKGKRADLTRADLTRADLTRADLTWADLTWADLTRADLYGADLDYSVWPLWCGTKGVRVDAKIAAQLAAHFCVLDCKDKGYLAARKAILKFAKTSHRAKDLGL